MSKKLKATVILAGISHAIEAKDGGTLSKLLRCFDYADGLAGLQGFRVPE